MGSDFTNYAVYYKLQQELGIFKKRITFPVNFPVKDTHNSLKHV